MMELKPIASFQVDHTKLTEGMYISRVDGDVVTYDIRMVKPNCPPYLPNGVLHTLEHLFATYARNSEYTEHVIYFGPMGCRTGFYFLVSGMTHGEVIGLIRSCFQWISSYEGEIPGRQVRQNAEITGNMIFPELENGPLLICLLSKDGQKRILSIKRNIVSAL